MSWNDGLTPEQETVASHIGQHARLLAGPGTGKTRALTSRISYLMQVRRNTMFWYSKGRNYKKAVGIREIRRTLQPLKYLGTPSEHPLCALYALGIYTWQQISKTPLCVNRVCNICSKAYVKPQLTPAGGLLVTSGQNLEAPWDFSYQRGKRELFRKRLPINVDNVSTRIFVSMLWKPQLYRILPHNPRTG